MINWRSSGDLGKILDSFGRNETVKVALVSTLHGRVPLQTKTSELARAAGWSRDRNANSPRPPLKIGILNSAFRSAGKLPLGRKLQTIGVKKWSASIMADG